MYRNTTKTKHKDRPETLFSTQVDQDEFGKVDVDSEALDEHQKQVNLRLHYSRKARSFIQVNRSALGSTLNALAITWSLVAEATKSGT